MKPIATDFNRVIKCELNEYAQGVAGWTIDGEKKAKKATVKARRALGRNLYAKLDAIRDGDLTEADNAFRELRGLATALKETI